MKTLNTNNPNKNKSNKSVPNEGRLTTPRSAAVAPSASDSSEPDVKPAVSTPGRRAGGRDVRKDARHESVSGKRGAQP